MLKDGKLKLLQWSVSHGCIFYIRAAVSGTNHVIGTLRNVCFKQNIYCRLDRQLALFKYSLVFTFTVSRSAHFFRRCFECCYSCCQSWMKRIEICVCKFKVIFTLLRSTLSWLGVIRNADYAMKETLLFRLSCVNAENCYVTEVSKLRCCMLFSTKALPMR